MDWRPYPLTSTSTVTGTLLVSDPLPAPELGRDVELLAWLPADHAERTTHRVIVFHDGHNLFDEPASYAGEWGLDETLAAMGSDVIAIGIPNAGENRLVEYCPWPSTVSDRALGEAYGAFVVDQVLPRVRSTLPVSSHREDTGVMGSSLGGLISLFLYLRYPETFGLVGSMSTAAWFTPDFWTFLETVDIPSGRVYLDVGTNEAPEEPGVSDAYLDTYRRLVRRFESEDLPLMAVEEPGAVHHEDAWARRLPRALQFLLGDAP